eukprot:scaffold4343_cov144-Cylindrotheca_fusiformis.AAC.16
MRGATNDCSKLALDGGQQFAFFSKIGEDFLYGENPCPRSFGFFVWSKIRLASNKPMVTVSSAARSPLRIKGLN